MKVLFVAGFGPVAGDPERSLRLYGEVLGLPLTTEAGYSHTGDLEGVRHFAVWPLAQAAESCFGSPRWPSDPPPPQAWIEFDVEDLEAATEELERAGHRLLVRARKEPWGQSVTRLLSPEGLLVGLTVTPGMREAAAPGPVA